MKNYSNKNNIFLFGGVSILVVIIGLASVIKGSDFLGIFFSVFLFFCLFVFFARYPDQTLSKIILLAFLLRSGFAYFQRFVAPLPDSTADAISFERRAWEAAEAMIYGGEKITLTGAYYYSAVISYLYYFFERVPLVAQFLNVLLGTLVVFVIYKIALVLFENKKVAHISAFIATIFPTFILYSAITMREVIIAFFTVLSFYFFSLWFKKGKVKPILFSLIFIFLSSIFHGAMIIIGFIYVFFFLFYQPVSNKWLFLKRQSIAIVLIALIVFSVFFSFFRTKIPGFADVSVEQLEKQVVRQSRNRAAYLEGVVPKNYVDVIVQSPIRIIYFYFAPFPWDLEKMLDVVGFVDVFLYLLLFIFCFKSLKRIRKENKALFVALILILIVFSIVFAWGTSNYGTALRHRQKIAFFLIIISSLSLSKINWKKFLPKIT